MSLELLPEEKCFVLESNDGNGFVRDIKVLQELVHFVQLLSRFVMRLCNRRELQERIESFGASELPCLSKSTLLHYKMHAV